MRLLKNILIAIVVIVVAVVVVGFFMPRQVEVARSTTIEAPPAAVFPFVNDLRRFNEWSPWKKLDPDAQYSFEGPDSGVGQKMSWSSDDPKVGAGTQEIVESVPGEKVRSTLDFGSMGTATATFDLAARDGSTEVSWRFQTDLGMNPLKRLMGPMFDQWVGSEYENGLASLKTLVEAQPAPEPEPEAAPEPEPEAAPQAEEPAMEQPAAEEPAMEQPAAEEPAMETPEAEQPAMETPEAEQPAMETPEAEQPAMETPEAEQPAMETPATEEPTMETPETERPAAE